MKIPFLQQINEDIILDISQNDFRKLLSKKGKNRFFLKWLSERTFVISLNFSIGTNFALDIDHNTKSAIIAYGTISELPHHQTHVKLFTKFKVGLLAILVIPIILLFLQLTIGLSIPLFFFIAPVIIYFLVIRFFYSEEKRLVSYFKEYVRLIEITGYNNV